MRKIIDVSEPGGCFLILVFVLLSPHLFAQYPQTAPLAPNPKASAQPTATNTGSAHELTERDLEAFLDGMLPLQLAREDIAGAVVSVVKDGKLIFIKGYGYADVEKRLPVSADTLFRPGSTCKLFTWTAVMQQVEQGRLDLDRDVNDYLDFRIPATYAKPITLRHLMTHTPGFEEAEKDLIVSEATDLEPLGTYLKEHLPDRIYPTGSTPAYSNYGAALAGYIVQRVSGEPFERYVDHHIFRPLGMLHTTLSQPLSESLQPLMSKGYDVASQPVKGFEFVQAGPAGSCSANALEMAHFMIAHLQNGQFDGQQLLRPETAQLMHSRQFSLRPDVNGMALGFYEESRNGHRIIGHGGDTQYFHSDLHLIPDAGIGFFVSYNSSGKGEISAREALWNKFLDRYFPNQPLGTSEMNAGQDGRDVAGRYIPSRRSTDTILKALTALGQLKVSVNSDGTITASDFKDLSGQPKKFREIGALMFRELDGRDQVAFTRDASGRIIMALDFFPPIVLLKARWYENSALSAPLIIGSLAILSLTLLLWPIAAVIRRHYDRRLILSPGQRRLRWLVRIVCVLDVAFFGAFAGFLASGITDASGSRYDSLLRVIELIGLLGVAGTTVTVYNATQSWRQRHLGLWSKLGDTVIALACIGVVWFVLAWNMLPWSLKY